MKRKILTITAIILAVALIVTIGTWVIGRKPFKNLKADEIQGISIHLWLYVIKDGAYAMVE